jgi:hypothetical protein
MDTSVRPWFSRGVALVGAGAIVMAPISPITPMASAATINVQASAAAISPEIRLAALDIPYILTLPIVRQSIKNWGANWAVYLAGLAKSGSGAVQSLLSIPGVTVEIIQEIFALDFVGAFNTFAAAIRDSVVAIGEPLLDSLIWRNQKYLLVQSALESAVPRAFIDVVNGFLAAGNVVTTSLIQGTQDLVAAVLTFNLGNIVDAFIDGTRNFLLSLGEGAGSIVDGIEAAQLGITNALKTTPPPSPFLDLQAPSVESTAGLAGAQARTIDLTLDRPVTDELEPVAVEELPVSEDAVTTAAGEPTETETVADPPAEIVDDETENEEVDPPISDEVTSPEDSLDEDDEVGTKAPETTPTDPETNAGPRPGETAADGTGDRDAPKEAAAA